MSIFPLKFHKSGLQMWENQIVHSDFSRWIIGVQVQRQKEIFKWIIFFKKHKGWTWRFLEIVSWYLGTLSDSINELELSLKQMPFYNQKWHWQRGTYKNKYPKEGHIQKNLSMPSVLPIRSWSSLVKDKYETLWNSKPATPHHIMIFPSENNNQSFIKHIRQDKFTIIVLWVRSASPKHLTFIIMRMSTKWRKSMNLASVVMVSSRV